MNNSTAKKIIPKIWKYIAVIIVAVTVMVEPKIIFIKREIP